MTYRNLFFFCYGLGCAGISRCLGYCPPGGLCCLEANVWYLGRYRGRRARLHIPVLVFTNAGCSVWLESPH